MGVRANTGGEPCGDTERYSVCLVFLNGADVCVNCCKVILCDSSGEYLNSDISRLLLSGYDNSVVLYVRRLIHSTGKSARDLDWRLCDLWACFGRPHTIFGRFRIVEAKPRILNLTPALAGYLGTDTP